MTLDVTFYVGQNRVRLFFFWVCLWSELDFSFSERLIWSCKIFLSGLAGLANRYLVRGTMHILQRSLLYSNVNNLIKTVLEIEERFNAKTWHVWSTSHGCCACQFSALELFLFGERIVKKICKWCSLFLDIWYRMTNNSLTGFEANKMMCFSFLNN